MSDDEKRPPPIAAVEQPQLDGPSSTYVQTCFWVASYVKARAARTNYTEEQLIEQFGVHVRNCIDPDWRPQG